MRLALANSDMTGEEYALYSYLYGNGARTLTQAARDFGLPITTLATLLGPLIEAGEIARRPHPTDRRARLLELTEAGRRKLEAAIPDFTVAHQALLGQPGTKRSTTRRCSPRWMPSARRLSAPATCWRRSSAEPGRSRRRRVCKMVRARVMLPMLMVLAACTPAVQPDPTALSTTPQATPLASPSPSATAVATPSAPSAPSFSVQTYRLPPGSGPHDVAPAADGGVWYTAQASGELGWLNPENGRGARDSAGPGAAPHGVIVGPDGAPWITDGGLNAIVRVDPATATR